MSVIRLVKFLAVLGALWVFFTTAPGWALALFWVGALLWPEPTHHHTLTDIVDTTTAAYRASRHE